MSDEQEFRTSRVAHFKIAFFAILEWEIFLPRRRDTFPVPMMLEKFAALERRTYGKFLNAAPPRMDGVREIS
jgi:hypothetical protein